MFDFLKTCGIGLLAIVLSPFIVVALALYAVYALFLFLFVLFKTVIIDLKNIFSKNGEVTNPFKELPEDIELKKILEREKEAIQNPGASNEPPAQNIVIQQNFYGSVPGQPGYNPQQGLPPVPDPSYFQNNPNGIPNGGFNNLPNNPYGQIPPQQFNQLPNNAGQNVINPDGHTLENNDESTSFKDGDK